MNKPIKPEITIPQSFAENGVKTDFDDTLLADGFDNLRPDVLAGDNLNKFIDDTYKGLNYGMAAADAINLINEGETLIVRDGKFTSGAVGAGGLEIGDIGFTQMAIDETKGKRRVLNGQLIIQEQYVQFTNIIKDSVALNSDLACTEEEWQTAVTMSANGVCYKYVIDDEAGTIRLPKYPEYFDIGIDGAKTVDVYGTGMTLGLYDGGNSGLCDRSDGSLGRKTSFYGTSAGTNTSGTAVVNQKTIGVTKDPAKSGLTGSVTTESEQIKGTYFIQVATGAETEDNIVNEIELNNPFSLLDYKYSEYELNNISWLRSNGQYNSKAVYPAVYDLLLKIYNGTETKAGVSVKLSTETFTDYDFVLNTAEETFRLPIKVKLASGKAVVGNGMTLGLTDGSEQYYGLAGAATGDLGNRLAAYKTKYGTSLPNSITNTTAVANGAAYGITTDPTKSGIETSDSDLYLYFYVGETVQNANLINAGRIEEKVASLIPDNSSLIASYTMPSSRHIELTLGATGSKYTAPANGYVLFTGQGSGYVALTQDEITVYNTLNVSGNYYSVLLPVVKGEFEAHYSGIKTITFRFIYAEGEVN